MPTSRSLLASVSRSARVSSSKREEAGPFQRPVVLRDVDLRAGRHLRQRREVGAREGLEVDVCRHEQRVPDAIAALERRMVLVRMPLAKPHERLRQERRATAERDQVEPPRLGLLRHQRDQPLDLRDERAGPAAVEEVVPDPGAGGPAERHDRG
jgi:hypothetical protein